MENASKALLIAGGIMLAMMIITMMVYMSDSITQIGEAQENKRAAQQLAAFNAEYEAYNKKLMYGTDIITVINKAIDYNGGLTPNETDEFVNIKLTLKDDFIGVKVSDGNRNEYGYGQEKLDEGTYMLRKEDSTLEMNRDIVKFFNSISDHRKEEEDGKTVYYYDGISDFKRAIFQCDKMLYDENTGKVNYIEFSQRETATY